MYKRVYKVFRTGGEKGKFQCNPPLALRSENDSSFKALRKKL